MSSLINSEYTSEIFAVCVKQLLMGEVPTQFSSILSTRPFPHLVLNDFLCSSEFLFCLRSELSISKWERKENDLYSLSQTTDLANFDRLHFPNLTAFRKLMLTAVRDWLSNASGIDLDEHVAITASRYHQTDILLPHDDSLDNRLFAFVLYLTPDWNSNFGGQLDLFSVDCMNIYPFISVIYSSASKRPASIVRSLSPRENRLVLFPVSAISWHRVNEWLVDNPSRLSLNGWFHSVRNTETLFVDSLSTVSRPFIDVQDILAWINPEYLDPSQQAEIRKSFENESQIILQDKYEDVLQELDTRSSFLSRGPPNKSQWTGLDLHSLVERDHNNDDMESDFLNKQICCLTSDLRRFDHRSYSMVDVETTVDSQKCGFCLDSHFFLVHSDWSTDFGGMTVYVEKDEQEPLLTVDPRANSLALVYREPDVFSFVKYVNIRTNQCFYSFTQSHLQIHQSSVCG